MSINNQMPVQHSNETWQLDDDFAEQHPCSGEGECVTQALHRGTQTHPPALISMTMSGQSYCLPALRKLQICLACRHFRGPQQCLLSDRISYK